MSNNNRVAWVRKHKKSYWQSLRESLSKISSTHTTRASANGWGQPQSQGMGQTQQPNNFAQQTPRQFRGSTSSSSSRSQRSSRSSIRDEAYGDGTGTAPRTDEQ
ncbi:hypothetical protein N0V90_004541 [Kalmusia sp. IMI 367209]|nr:hypothetical protein N0V90_004541 [Kalmusia sp. IMI 367209]